MKNWFTKLNISKKLALIAGLLAVFALLIGNTNNTKISVDAKELALSTVKDNDQISTMLLADWLIKEKGDYTLVDLRNEKEYNEYSLPNAVNIKMEDLLGSELRRNEKILFFGANDIASAQAWFILKSAGYKGVYILKGGMQSWKNEVLFPTYTIGSSIQDSLKFESLKQVSLHFGGSPGVQSAGGLPSNAAITETKLVTPAAPKLTAPKGTSVKKKKEGC